MNYGGFILGCITVILILLIVCAFIYPNTIYDSSIILLTAISSIAWIIVYMSTRTLRCIQNDNPKELICKIGGNGRKYKIKGGIKGGINTNYYNTITGGIDSIPEEKKQNIIELINFIRLGSSNNPYNPIDEVNLNKLLLSMDKALVECSKDYIRGHNDDLVLLRYIDQNITIKSDILNKYNNDKYIFSQISPNNFKLNNFELIGLNLNTGGHFIAYVKYEKGWYIMDSVITDKYNIITEEEVNNTIKTSQSRIFNENNFQYEPQINNLSPEPSIYLYRNKNNTKLKENQPIFLRQFLNICYAAAPLQLLMATDLLDEPAAKTPASAETPAPVQPPVQPPAKTPAPTPAQNVTTSTPQVPTSKAKYLIGLIYTPDNESKDNSEQKYANYKNIMTSAIYITITKPTLVIYNENFTQYANKDIEPGDNNGIIRPLRYDVPNRKINKNLYVLGIPTSDHNPANQIKAEDKKYSTPIDNIINLIKEKNIEVVIFGMPEDKFTLDIRIFKNYPHAEDNRNYYFNMLIERLGNDFQKFYFANNDNIYNLTYNDKVVQRLQSLQQLLAPTPAPVSTPIPVQQQPQPPAQPQAQPPAQPTPVPASAQPTPVPAPAQPQAQAQPQPQAQTDEQNLEKLQKEDQSRSNLNRDLSDNSTENNKPKDYDVYKQNLEESEQYKIKFEKLQKEEQEALNTAAKTVTPVKQTAKNIVPQVLNTATQKAKEDDEYEDYEDDFEISDPYTSYGSSYSSGSIKNISKRYGTDNTSFDKFYKELLHSEIL